MLNINVKSIADKYLPADVVNAELATDDSISTEICSFVDGKIAEVVAKTGEVSDLSAQVSALSYQVSTLTDSDLADDAQIAALIGDKILLTSEKAALVSQVSDLSAQISALGGDKTTLNAQIVALNSEKSTIKNDLIEVVVNLGIASNAIARDEVPWLRALCEKDIELAKNKVFRSVV